MVRHRHSQTLRLRDSDWKSLGRSRIQPGSVACAANLVEGKHYEIDYHLGRVRPINGYACDDLCAFTFEYDDRAEAFAAVEAERRVLLEQVRAKAQADPAFEALAKLLGVL